MALGPDGRNRRRGPPGGRPRKSASRTQHYPEVFLDVLLRGPQPGGGSEKQVSALPGGHRYDFEKVVVHGFCADIFRSAIRRVALKCRVSDEILHPCRLCVDARGKILADCGSVRWIGNDGLKPLQDSVLVDRKSTRLNSSHRCISYAVFCL